MSDIDIDDVVTPGVRKKMTSFVLSHVKRFPTVNVAEGLVDFAERKRVLVAGTSARPGPYRFSVTPYLREIAENLSEYTKCTELCVMKATQTGGTDGVMMNHELYCMHYGIGPILYVTSDDDMAQEHMEKRVDPMISSADMQDLITPAVQKKGNKSTGDSRRAKSFRGTFLRATGARSESKLSSFPVRVLHVDEIDKYPVSLIGGGSSVEKAIRRTDSYGNLRKICQISTPKEKATSRIEQLFQQGDMRLYFVPCTKCGHMQPLKWAQMKWEKTATGKIALNFDEHGHVINNPVWHECESEECRYKMRDFEKVHFMCEKNYGGEAEWRPAKKPDRPGLRSYHINGLYGFRSWIDIVLQWDKIDGDPVLLQDFINDVLGETYEAKLDKPDEHYLAARAETDWVRGDINENVSVLTLGADVQKDRIEAALMGWTNRKEAWAIEYYTFPGNTNDPTDECWHNLEEVIRAEYTKTNGETQRLQIAFVDAPYENSSVMEFCQRFTYNPRSWVGVYPAFGRQTLSSIIKEHDSTIATPEILMNDQQLKFEIYTNLKRKVPVRGNGFPPGFIHFPEDYGEDYYRQMVSEEVTETINNKGISTLFISNTKQRRNEVLDCTKMCLAALYYMYLTYFKLWNTKRKASKQKDIRPDWGVFWSLFGEEKGNE